MLVSCTTAISSGWSGPLRRDFGVHGLDEGAACGVTAGEAGSCVVLAGLTLTLTRASASRDLGSGIMTGVCVNALAAGDGGDTEECSVEVRGGCDKAVGVRSTGAGGVGDGSACATDASDVLADAVQLDTLVAALKRLLSRPGVGGEYKGSVLIPRRYRLRVPSTDAIELPLRRDGVCGGVMRARGCL
jgi:hypothetical protein